MEIAVSSRAIKIQGQLFRAGLSRNGVVVSDRMVEILTFVEDSAELAKKIAVLLGGTIETTPCLKINLPR